MQVTDRCLDLNVWPNIIIASLQPTSWTCQDSKFQYKQRNAQPSVQVKRSSEVEPTRSRAQTHKAQDEAKWEVGQDIWGMKALGSGGMLMLQDYWTKTSRAATLRFSELFGWEPKSSREDADNGLTLW